MRDITEAVKESQEAIEAIQPSTGTKIWQVAGFDGGGTAYEREYIQEELSFFYKQEFITLMNSYLGDFLDGKFGIKVSDLFGDGMRRRLQLPTEVTAEAAEKAVKENEAMIRAFSTLVDKLPGFQQEIIVLSLGVPRADRVVVMATLTGPVSRGGLTDSQGFEILENFIRQNAKTIRDFFTEKAPKLVQAAREELGLINEETDSTDAPLDDSPGGTPSTTSSPDTLASV